MMSGMREAHSAVLTTGHAWAQQKVFQGGALGTVVFRATAIRAALCSAPRRIRAGAWLGKFRPSFLLARFCSHFLLREPGYRCCLPRFC